MTLVLTGKDKAARVPLDYFRQIGRRKWVITGVITAISLLALGVAVGSGWWKSAASPGPVNFVHARWENDCAICHAPFKPTGSQSALQGVLGVGTTPDGLCKNCHNGPQHHPGSEVAGESGSCSHCHVEHRGRQSSLARSPDPTCTNCHADLKAHTLTKETNFANRITRFDRDHPQFKVDQIDPTTGAHTRKVLGEATDPGKLKFNHQLHLISGQRLSENESGGWKLGNIADPKLRERYRLQQPEGDTNNADLVTLTCASCHQLDSSDAPPTGTGTVLPARSSGDYYLPVTFDQHCKACHPLSINTAAGKVDIPHHLQPDAVRRFLSGSLLDAELRPKKDKAEEGSGRPLPGSNLSLTELKKKTEGQVKAAEADLYLENIKKAEAFVFGGKTTCGLCHSFEWKKGDGIPIRVVPTNVPQVWFPHARFSHQGHRAMACSACHDPKDSTTQASVLLPKVAICKQCHAPAKLFAQEPEGGVRYECTTCHLYHQGETPLAGRGAAKRAAEKRGKAEMLKGTLGKQ